MSRRVGVSYKQQSPDDRWDAIVIGSGLGGLACATLLAKHGQKRVLVLERHSTAGGFTHTFTRPGFEWDVGVHYLGQLEEGSPLRALFDEISGGRLEWAKMPDTYDRVILKDEPYDLVAGGRRFVDTLAERFPGRRADISRYLDTMLAATRTGGTFFLDRALPSRLSTLVGPLLRAPLRRWSDRTAEDVIKPIVGDGPLYDVLTAQCGDYGLTPRFASFAIHAMVAGHYLRGAYYPVGGSRSIPEHVTQTLEEHGGAVFVAAEVERILVERGRAVGVRMNDGRELRAPIVVSDAGAPNTYLRLLPREIAEPTGLPARLREIGPSSGHLSLYLGLDRTDRELGLDGTNLWIYPEPDREKAFAQFVHDPSAPIPLVYASFPSAKDPTFAARHPGKATVELVTLARASWLERWKDARWKKRGQDYEAWKAEMSDRLLDIALVQRPSLKGHIVHSELSTPLSTRHFTGHPDGEIYGLDHTPARFRLPLRAQTPVPGLYLAGQDLVSCGVAGALFGGALAAAAVLRGSLVTSLARRALGRPSPSATPPRPAAATHEAGARGAALS
ncbi:MAG: NAD(P)/FAD-dependent oxidoreductase [Deltaproteobacteria bacterium]|nr:NAD(P)/FAD-dependent oxidoreductase [Deltaproteobacteria bacterium]